MQILILVKTVNFYSNFCNVIFTQTDRCLVDCFDIQS